MCTYSKFNRIYFVFKGISLIEWPSRLGALLPKDRLDITFRILNIDESQISGEEEYDNTRHLVLEAHGKKWKERLKNIDVEGYLDDMIIESE